MGFLGARTVGATRESFPLFRCPSCRKSGVMDGDQFHGRTSIICRCGWHKTVNWDRLDTGEREDAFMDRCMGADGMVEEFPESDQRAAVCHKQFRGNAAPPVVNVTAKVRMMRESRQRREFAFSGQVNGG